MSAALRPCYGLVRSRGPTSFTQQWAPAVVHTAVRSLSGSAASSQKSISGDVNAPLLDTTLATYLDDAEKRLEHRDAVRAVYSDYRWTWKEFATHTRAVAVGFHEAGRVRAGQRILSGLSNNLEHLTSLMASGYIGSVLVSSNPSADAGELKELLQRTDPRVVLVPLTFGGVDKIAALGEIIPGLEKTYHGHRVHSDLAPSLVNPIHIGPEKVHGFLTFRHMAVYSPMPSPLIGTQAAVRPSDLVTVDVAPGVEPPVASTHASLLSNASFVGQRLGLTKDDRVCVSSSLRGAAGLACGPLACITSGALQILPSNLFDSDVTLNTLFEESCSVLVVDAPDLASLIDNPRVKKLNLDTLRRVLVVSNTTQDAPSSDLLARAISTLGLDEVQVAFSASHVGGVIAQTSGPSDKVLGTLLPHTEAKIDGAGTLCVKGHQVSAAGPGDGWASTGVKASLDGDVFSRL
eukprot:TRINITY_DN7148_c0_g1_i1.p1 TRINITY_DN7148_c0_g1~~TRINITY_DN7148_c0_g1_i1.p1  ORF type:complete len:462 (-),score=81.56 TRINITY_DN7148_c0_g1_i1:153-1538(-)